MWLFTILEPEFPLFMKAAEGMERISGDISRIKRENLSALVELYKSWCKGL